MSPWNSASICTAHVHQPSHKVESKSLLVHVMQCCYILWIEKKKKKNTPAQMTVVDMDYGSQPPKKTKLFFFCFTSHMCCLDGFGLPGRFEHKSMALTERLLRDYCL